MNQLAGVQAPPNAAADSRIAPQVSHTLYQVSTATALVEGIYQGAVRVGALRQYGNLGLGTFEYLDGETTN